MRCNNPDEMSLDIYISCQYTCIQRIDGKGRSKSARLDLDFDRRRYYYRYFTCYKKPADKKVAKGYMGYSAVLK